MRGDKDTVRLLAIDPASKRTGYALLTGLGPNELVECGVLVGSERPDYWPTRYDFGGGDLAAFRRIVDIGEGLGHLIREHRPKWVVIEIPSGKVGTGARRGASGSLTTYGFAAGWLAHLAATAPPLVPGIRLSAITERQWTRGGMGRGGKAARVAAIGALYQPVGGKSWQELDPGGDARDAIGLGRWAIERGEM